MDINQITEGVIWKQLLVFFFPILFGTFFQQLYNTTDAVVVGNFVGKQALAAVGGPASTLINLLVGFFTGLSSGATVVISQFYGAKHKDDVRKAVHTSIALSIAGGAIIMALGIIFAGVALRAMNTPEDIMGLSLIYMRIYFLGVIPSLIYNMGSGILRAIGDSKRPLYYLIASTLTNIVLDLFFVVVLKLGVAGVAIATTLSQFASAGMVIYALMKTDDMYKLYPREIRFSPQHPVRHHPHRPACGPAVHHVFRLQPDHPGQHQLLRDRYHRRLDGLQQGGRHVLDDHERLRRFHHHLRRTELRCGQI